MNDKKIRGLSVRQPWAHAIIHLGKDVENRSYPTHHRGRLLIHASKGISKDGMQKLKLEGEQLPGGAIVGDVEVYDCIQNSKSKWAERGSWHWLLRNPRAISKPIKLKGKVGFLLVPEALLRSVRFRKT